MQKKAAVEMAAECPYDFNWHEALYVLYALQHNEAMNKQYAPNVFYNEIFKVLTGLRNLVSRKTVLGQLQNPVCVAPECEEVVKLTRARLDHIIPVSRGGPGNLENTMPLCRSHNSSKGNKDLIEWWAFKEWPAPTLPRSILCIYARLMFQHIDTVAFADPHDLPDYVRVFITDRAAALPDEHRLALYGSTYAAMAFLGWERLHESIGIY